jgi:hypothetical protein
MKVLKDLEYMTYKFNLQWYPRKEFGGISSEQHSRFKMSCRCGVIFIQVFPSFRILSVATSLLLYLQNITCIQILGRISQEQGCLIFQKIQYIIMTFQTFQAARWFYKHIM